MAKNIWADEAKVELLTELYTKAVEEQTANVASTSDFLGKLGKDYFDGASDKQIRGKLISLGIYVKPDAPAASPKANPVRKEHYVRAIANNLQLDADELDSLKGGKVSALSTLAEKLGVTDVLEAAAKDAEPRPELVVMRIMENLSVDIDDLETYQAELEEAAEQNGE